MSNMVTVLVEVVIFTALIGVIANEVAGPNANITGAGLVMYGLITLFVIIGFILGLMKTLGIKTK